MERTKLGLDCPTGLLHIVQPLADYDYVMVDKVQQDSHYLEYFKNSKRPKILNNRILMQWDPLPLENIKAVWEVLGGEVIAPDWMWDSDKTFGAYEECCHYFGKDNVIGVMQGVTDEDVAIARKMYGKKIAIPFDVGSPKEAPIELKVERRVILVGKLEDKEIHLLGLTSWKELEFYGYPDTVVSINTGLPIKCALDRVYLRDYDEDKKHSAYHSMDMNYPIFDTRTLRLLEDNIMFIRELL